MKAPTAKRRTDAERDALVEQYLPLVRYVVARLPVTMPATLNRDDFYSVGVMGLLHAASNYDPERGASFKTFAFTAIRGAILDEIRRLDPVPRSRRDRLRRIERASSELQTALDRTPTVEEIAERLGTTVEALDEDYLAQHTCRVLSLDDSHGNDDDGASLGARLESANQEDPGDRVIHLEDTERLAKAISELPEVERHVVVLYHFESLFLKEIGSILGVTESRISQILSRAMERLHMKLNP
ncbi:MAG: FliA/WhiG family RNA polymerase sigma factor [Planctomycetota bacterium]